MKEVYFARKPFHKRNTYLRFTMPVFEFQYQAYPSSEGLSTSFQELLNRARLATQKAYAPYSNFWVGAAVLLENGAIVEGVNIENASYPVGICAERTALSSVISQFPDQKIKAIAISYQTASGNSGKPAFPCGMCRQFISECEDRNREPIILILSGLEGEVFQIDTVKHLLPFSFGGTDLQAPASE